LITPFSELAEIVVFHVDKKKTYFSKPSEICQLKKFKTTMIESERENMLKLILGMARMDMGIFQMAATTQPQGAIQAVSKQDYTKSD
jgi:hypothetical protein